MKRLVLLFLLISGVIPLSYAQTNTENQYTLSGTVKGFKGGNVLLFGGACTDTIKPSAGGMFKKTFKVKTSPTDKLILFKSNKKSFYIYARNGYVSTIYADLRKIKPIIIFGGDGKDVNEYYQKFYRYFQPDYPTTLQAKIVPKMNFRTYTNKINEEKKECYVFLSKITDEKIRKEQSIVLDCATLKKKLDYFSVHTKEAKDADKNYTAFIRSIDLNNLDYAKSGITDRVICWNMDIQQLNKKNGTEYMNEVVDLVTNQHAVNILITQWIKNYLKLPDNNVHLYFKKYLKFCTDKNAIFSLNKEYEWAKSVLRGNFAPDFTMKDPDGKLYKLSDFKGRSVYIEVWGTWCNRCLYQIPFLKKLVDKYKGNNDVELIGISLDANKTQWKKMITAQHLVWKQFIVDNNFYSDLCKKYKIYTIPRFMLIDGEGKIVSINAPCPSDEKITDFIDDNI